MMKRFSIVVLLTLLAVGVFVLSCGKNEVTTIAESIYSDVIRPGSQTPADDPAPDVPDDPGQGGEDPGQGGEDPGQGGEDPGQGGEDPGQGGEDPGQGGEDPGQGGEDPGQGGEDPGQGGDDPGQGGEDPGQGGEDPGQGGDPTPQPVDRMPNYVESSATTINVSTSNTGIRIAGLGAELDPHFLSQNVTRNDGSRKADWNKYIVNRAKAMGIQRYRVMVQPHWWEPDNDNNNPNVMDDSQFTWNSKEMESLYAVLDLAQSSDATVTLVFWGCPIDAKLVDGTYVGRHFLCDNGSTWVTAASNNDELAENVAALIKHLVRVKGYTCVKEFTPFNEPDGFSTIKDSYVNATKAIHARLQSEGLNIAMNLSDNTDGGESFYRSVVSNLSSYATLYNTHTYIFNYSTGNNTMVNWERTNVNIANGKPHFVGEFGSSMHNNSASRQDDVNWPVRGILVGRMVCNFLNAGATGCSYWGLIDQYYNKSDAYDQMQQLGMWRYAYKAYSGTELQAIIDAGQQNVDYSCRPQYYAYSLLTRFIRRDSYIYPISTGDDFVAATAAWDANGRWTFAFASQKESAINYNLNNPNHNTTDNFDVYVYRQSDFEAGGTPPQEGALIEASTLLRKSDAGHYKLHIPARSVVVLHQHSN
ncbi:MAG: hypothetical protein IJU13_03140 [Bacteroidales bacterium]|nr:hypothetical protein [Bacteroidales bacterium]